MSTNYRQARREDSSDDEGPTKRVKHNDDDDEAPVGQARPQGAAANKKASRNVWADVVQEEELTIKSNIMDMNDYRKRGSDFVKIKRGAESYTVPSATLDDNAAALEAGKNMDNLLPEPTPSDDPFGDTVDLGEVEAFGVGPSSSRNNNRGNWQPRGARGRGVRGGWMNKPRGDHHHQAPRSEGDGMEMDQGEGGEVATGEGSHRGRGGRGGWRGGARGFVPRGRGHFRGGDDRKRKWNHDPHAHAKDPTELMDGGYSLEALVATVFPEGLALKELGEQIAKALGEKEGDTIPKIVEAVGEKKALEILEETKKAEQAGGVKVADGSRRRTPGGVYILLFKSDVDVDPAVKGLIFDDGKAEQRKMAKARKKYDKKKNQKQNVDQDLDDLQKLLEEKKKELQAKEEREDGEATPSPMNDGGEELEDDNTSPESAEME